MVAMKSIQMIGRKFGRLIVTKRDYSCKKRNLQWICKCACGNKSSVTGIGLRSGRTRSCGCLKAEIIKNGANLRHGYSRSRNRPGVYGSWCGMITRCLNVRSKKFKHYGGRGIQVCLRWRKFENFLSDMGERPANLTLDRINNDWSYMPSNCRWATRREQRINQRPRHNPKNLSGLW